MATHIEQIDDTTYQVNGKTCYKNSNGQWQETEELTTQEAGDFSKHLRTVSG